MRIAATGAMLLFAFTACTTTTSNQKPTSDSPFTQPNSLIAGEITRRVEQIPYQHRDELLQNLLWLTQAGEQVIPSMLDGLRHEQPKVRSSCAWVLGRLRDRRTIPNLQAAVNDKEPTVRFEVARTLVLMGDLAQAPSLIEGLDSDRKEVRYLCHEALKTGTGHDFGYDHLNDNQKDLQVAVLRWRQWWSDYAGDPFFAQNYQQKHGLQAQPAMPIGETKPANDQGGNPPNPDENAAVPMPGTETVPPTPPNPRPNGGN